MARINRSDVIQKAVNDLAFSASGEKIPNETLDKVQLTYNLNRQFSTFIVSTSSSATGTTTLTLTGIPGDIYITSINLSLIKDATCDIATGKFQGTATTDLGVATALVGIAMLTLTAQSENIYVSFPYPIKLKSGTNMSFAKTFTAGALSFGVSVTGFNVSSN